LGLLVNKEEGIMSLPEFTAEASVYQSKGRYMMGGIPADTARPVLSPAYYKPEAIEFAHLPGPGSAWGNEIWIMLQCSRACNAVVPANDDVGWYECYMRCMGESPYWPD
jgi:hypothetical protein